MLVKVKEGRWKEGRPSDVLITNGVYVCLALAVHNSRSHKGYLGHFNLGFGRKLKLKDEPSPDELLDKAARDAKKTTHLKAWPAGLAIPARRLVTDYKEVAANQAHLRAKIVRLILKYGMELADEPLWLPANKVLDVGLRCADGRITPKVGLTNLPKK